MGRGKNWTDKEKYELRKMRNEGKTYKEIAEKMDRTKLSIKSMWERMNTAESHFVKNYDKNMEMMNKFKEDFHLKENQEVKVINHKEKRKTIKKGTIKKITKRIVLIKFKHYKETFNYGDLFSKDVEIIPLVVKS